MLNAFISPEFTKSLNRTIPFVLSRFIIIIIIIIINQSIHWHVQNAVIPFRSQEPLPFLPVIHFLLPLLSADHSSILPDFIQPSNYYYYYYYYYYY